MARRPLRNYLQLPTRTPDTLLYDDKVRPAPAASAFLSFFPCQRQSRVCRSRFRILQRRLSISTSCVFIAREKYWYTGPYSVHASFLSFSLPHYTQARKGFIMSSATGYRMCPQTLFLPSSQHTGKGGCHEELHQWPQSMPLTLNTDTQTQTNPSSFLMTHRRRRVP